MKKRVLAAIFAGIMVIGLAACGSKEDDQDTEQNVQENTQEDVQEEVETGEEQGTTDETVSALSGSFVLSAILDTEGNEFTLEEYCTAQGLDAAGEAKTYTFYEDGTGVGQIGGTETEFTYTMDSATGAVTITIDEQPQAFTYNAEYDCLTVEDAETGVIGVLIRA